MNERYALGQNQTNQDNSPQLKGVNNYSARIAASQEYPNGQLRKLQNPNIALDYGSPYNPIQQPMRYLRTDDITGAQPKHWGMQVNKSSVAGNPSGSQRSYKNESHIFNHIYESVNSHFAPRNLPVKNGESKVGSGERKPQMTGGFEQAPLYIRNYGSNQQPLGVSPQQINRQYQPEVNPPPQSNYTLAAPVYQSQYMRQYNSEQNTQSRKSLPQPEEPSQNPSTIIQSTYQKNYNQLQELQKQLEKERIKRIAMSRYMNASPNQNGQSAQDLNQYQSAIRVQDEQRSNNQMKPEIDPSFQRNYAAFFGLDRIPPARVVEEALSKSRLQKKYTQSNDNEKVKHLPTPLKRDPSFQRNMERFYGSAEAPANVERSPVDLRRSTSLLASGSGIINSVFEYKIENHIQKNGRNLYYQVMFDKQRMSDNYQPQTNGSPGQRLQQTPGQNYRALVNDGMNRRYIAQEPNKMDYPRSQQIPLKPTNYESPLKLNQTIVEPQLNYSLGPAEIKQSRSPMESKNAQDYLASYKSVAPKLNDMNYHRLQQQKAPFKFDVITGNYSIRPLV